MILSGAPSVYGVHEVEVMEQWLKKRNITPPELYRDYDGYDTLQTILNLPSTRRYIFISNDFHLARIWLTANMLGLRDFQLQPSAYQQGEPSDRWLLVVREIIGSWYYVVAAWIAAGQL